MKSFVGVVDLSGGKIGVLEWDTFNPILFVNFPDVSFSVALTGVYLCAISGLCVCLFNILTSLQPALFVYTHFVLNSST